MSHDVQQHRTSLILFAINTAVYVSTSVYSESLTTSFDIIRWTALSLAKEHYWMIWTPFTTLFIHSNFLHYLSNMIILLIVGSELDKYLTNLEMVSFYFLCGILGGIVSLLVFYDPNSYTVGASGSIFGMSGSLFIITLKRKEKYFPFILVIILGASIFFSEWSVNIFSHIIGFILGAIFTIFIFKSDKDVKSVA